MLAANVLNPEKKTIDGRVFHIFYLDLNTAILFDRDLTIPIIFGSKNIVITHLKQMDDYLKVKADTIVRIYSYVLGQEGYRRIQTYNAPIKNIGRYLIRY
jgi:hypothetical protein